MKKTIKLSWLFAGVFYLNISNVYSEPSKTFSYLMNEPTTMLDFGMYKIKNELLYKDPINSSDLVQSIHSNGKMIDVTYSWEMNKLTLKYNFYLKKEALKKKTAIDYCKLATNEIRGYFGATYEGEYAKDIREFSSIYKYFKHDGFTNKNTPENIMDEIENSTIISVSIRSNFQDKAPFEQKAECESPLLSNATYLKQ